MLFHWDLKFLQGIECICIVRIALQGKRHHSVRSHEDWAPNAVCQLENQCRFQYMLNLGSDMESFKDEFPVFQ